MFAFWSLTAIELQKSKHSRSILALIQRLLKLIKTLPQILNQAINVHCNVSMCSLLNINDEGPRLFLAGMERTTCGTTGTSKRRYSHITLVECLSDGSELPFKVCSEEFLFLEPRHFLTENQVVDMFLYQSELSRKLY